MVAHRKWLQSPHTCIPPQFPVALPFPEPEKSHELLYKNVELEVSGALVFCLSHHGRMGCLQRASEGTSEKKKSLSPAH